MIETIVICQLDSEPSPFLDNIQGECIACKKPIHFRPYVPEKTTKVCIDCFKNKYEKSGTQVIMMKESVKELEKMRKS